MRQKKTKTPTIVAKIRTIRQDRTETKYVSQSQWKQFKRKVLTGTIMENEL